MSVKASSGGACVGTSDRSGGNNVGNEWSIEIERFNEEEKMQFDSFQIDSFQKASEADNKTDLPADTNPKIQKVQPMLRDNHKLKKYFEPKMFSFGPYSDYPHRTLKMAKQIKVNLAAEFLRQNGVKKEDLYEDIKKRINELRNCYADDLTDNYKDKDNKLAWMFLVDGCAILQFMYIFVDFQSESQFRKLGIKFDYRFFLVHDLFLLENQLPYQLLRRIIQHTSKEDDLLKSIYKFIFYYFRTSEEWKKNKDEILEDLKHEHVHLLDLLRKKLIQPFHQIDKKCDLIESIIGLADVLFDKLRCNENESNQFDRAPVSLCNIGKLREAGIELKPSETSCVRDIRFSGGTLKLPPIIVDQSTATMFLNMLGYEMCPDFPNESEVSSYMHFIDKLIDGTQDVEELREKNILRNQLGRDEEVAELFNEIGSHLFPNYEIYSMVKWKIDNYFHNKWLICLRKVPQDIRQYFKGRWSLLALIAALLALTSGIIQTVYTVLAYHAD